MRIGIDARLLHYTKGGISQYILRLLDGLAQLCPPDDIAVLRSRKSAPTAFAGCPFRQVPIFTPPHNRFEQTALRLEMSRLHLDLLHSPDFIPPFRRRFKSVITVHDLAFLLYPHLLTRESAHYYGQIDQAVRSADHIIAVSESTKRDVTRLLGAPEDRVSVIHEAINPCFQVMADRVAVEAARVKHGLPERYIVFVGTIEPRKNLPTLFKAMRILADQYSPGVALAVIGEWGWLYDDVLQTYEKLRLQDVVRFLGHVDASELVALYNGAAALAYPSYYEGFGLPPLEAMACGAPVVASNTSSMPEVIGDAGLLVSPDDAEAIAVALWRLLSDAQLRQTLVERGFQRVRGFSVQGMAQKTLDLYHSVLGVSG